MILCFSGTGNSLLVARQLSQQLAQQVVMLEHDLLLDPQAHPLQLAEGEPMVWVMPIYSWGVPRVVKRFIRHARIAGAPEAAHYLVCTCGDDIGYADNQWRNLLSHRGWTSRGSFSVQMPNTYVLMKGFDVDTPDVAAAKLAAMPERVTSIGGRILAGSIDSDVVRGSFPWVKTHIIYPWFTAFATSPRPFRAEAACTSCGLCARTCPLGNIAMNAAATIPTATPAQDVTSSPAAPSSSHPTWGRICALCLRCYHQCPHHAVAYGTATATKGQKPVTV